MTKHLPECQRWYASTVDPDECAACEMFRACEQRVLDAAQQAIRHALAGDGRNLYAELTAIAAIEALREKP